MHKEHHKKHHKDHHEENCVVKGSMSPHDRAKREKHHEDHMDTQGTGMERKPKIIKKHSGDVHPGGIYK